MRHRHSLHSAARLGNLAMVKLLLDHGADPNEEIDSTSNAMVFAATPEIRALLESHGGGLGPYDTTWIEHDDELLRRVAADPSDTHRVGAAFTMSADRPDLLARLLGAGLRMPAVHTSCQGYLLNADALRTLLAHGMSPDQMNWQHQTLLHLASSAGHDRMRRHPARRRRHDHSQRRRVSVNAARLGRTSQQTSDGRVPAVARRPRQPAR